MVKEIELEEKLDLYCITNSGKIEAKKLLRNYEPFLSSGIEISKGKKILSKIPKRKQKRT